MATLTNTQISVTYVGLLKTSGNTILDSTPQQITDGSGNNSQLFLSTTKVGVGATPSGSDTLQITGTSSFSSHVTLADNAELRIGTSTDLQASHDGTDSFIINNTGDLYIRNTADDKDIIFQSDDGSGGVTEYFRLDGSDSKVPFSKNLGINDNIQIQIGSGSDLRLRHDSADSYIQNYTGDLYIENLADDKDIIFQSDDGSGGVAEYFRVDGGLEEVIFSKSTRHMDNVQAKFGSGEDLKIFHNANDSIIQNNTGDLYIENTANDKDIIFLTDNGSGGVETYFRLDGSANSDGNPRTIFPDNSRLIFGDGFDLDIFHNGTDSFIRNNTNGNLTIQNGADDKDIIFQSDDGSGGTTEYFRVDGGTTSIIASKNVELLDNVELKIGTGNDLNIRHSGTESFIQNQTGNLTIQNLTDNGDIIFKSDDGSGGLAEYFRVDGGDERTIFSKGVKMLDTVNFIAGTGNDLKIRHNGTNSIIENNTGNLEITNKSDDKDIIFQSDDGSGGVTEYFRLDGGNTQVQFSKNTNYIDGIQASFGASGDLKISHSGTDSAIENETGHFYIINDANDSDIVFQAEDGSGGVTTYFTVDGSAIDVVFNKDIHLNDNVNLLAGTGGDLRIYHNGSDSYIDDSGTGTLRIRSNFLTIEKYNNGEIMASFNDDNAVSLYHDNSKKFETTSSGVKIPTAGDGLQLVSPNGTVFTVTVDNSGNLSVA